MTLRVSLFLQVVVLPGRVPNVGNVIGHLTV
jgi:hypothetical protein